MEGAVRQYVWASGAFLHGGATRSMGCAIRSLFRQSSHGRSIRTRPLIISMRQKSHTLDRAASPSPILMFWFFYDDCIIINSANAFKSFCRVSILFLASWFACDACTITSPLTLHILWTLNHGVQICQTGQSLATAPYGHEQICNHDLLHTERNVQEIYT